MDGTMWLMFKKTASKSMALTSSALANAALGLDVRAPAPRTALSGEPPST